MRRAPEAHDPTTRSGKPRNRRAAAGAATPIAIAPDDQFLFDSLRSWRREEASRQAVPPYVIFHDRTLAEIAQSRPNSAGALAKIGGVGQGKLDRYGAEVLRLVAQG